MRTNCDQLAQRRRPCWTREPFHAHEVFEDAWKSGPESERALWRGLAQLAVGLTHAARGNRTGGARLLRRGAGAVEEWAAGAGRRGPTGWTSPNWPGGRAHWRTRCSGRTRRWTRGPGRRGCADTRHGHCQWRTADSRRARDSCHRNRRGRPGPAHRAGGQRHARSTCSSSWTRARRSSDLTGRARRCWTSHTRRLPGGRGPDPPRDRTAADYEGAVGTGATSARRHRGGADRRGAGEDGERRDPRLGRSGAVRQHDPHPGRDRRPGHGDVDYEVIPGITSVQALAARHRIMLNRVARPVHITTGRRLAAGSRRGGRRRRHARRGLAFREYADEDVDIYWGAYLGTPDEILVAGAVRRGRRPRSSGARRGPRTQGLDHGHVPAAP